MGQFFSARKRMLNFLSIFKFEFQSDMKNRLGNFSIFRDFSQKNKNARTFF